MCPLTKRSLPLVGAIWRTGMVPILLVVVLAAGASYSLELYHYLAEFLGIALAAMVAAVGWHSFPLSQNRLVLFISMGLFWTAILSLIHLLLDAGMGVAGDDNSDISVQFFMLPALFSSFVLFVAPGASGQIFGRFKLFAALGLCAGFLVMLVWSGLYSLVGDPEAVRVGASGATVLLLLAAMYRFQSVRKRLADGFLAWILGALGLALLAAISGYGYGSGTVRENLSHFFTLLSLWCIYHLIVEEGLSQPLRLLTKRERQLRLLVSAVRETNAVLESSAVMRALVSNGMRLIDAASGITGIMEGKEMIFREYHRGTELIAIDYRFSEGEGVPGEVMRTARPYLIADARRDPHVIPEIREQLGFINLINVPILSHDDVLLGCFELHDKRDGAFNPYDVELLEGLAAGAAVALENAQILLERSEMEQSLRQARSLYENSSEGMVITSTEPEILAVNPAFSHITGYSEAEVLGRNPRILQSGRHNQAFYAEMWRALTEEGVWRGEIWNRRKSGEIYPEWLTISAVLNPAGETSHYVSVLSDISVLKRSQERMEYLAHHDALTGLPNRLLCRIRLQHALERAQRNARQVGVIFLDLDGFKDVNDSLGHPVGDELLKQVAQRLEARIRKEDTVARFGGDEFLLILEEINEPQAVALVAESVLRALNEAFMLGEHEVFISASMGVSLYPQDGANNTTLMKHADLALYRAKAEGKNNYQFFSLSLAVGVGERIKLEAELRHAVERNELSIIYQPLVRVASGEVIALEAMLRWQHPEYGRVSPERFIPIAEQTGLIVPIGEWALGQACHQLQRFHGEGYSGLRVAVNLTSRQLQRGRVAQVIPQILRQAGLIPGNLVLELTEQAFFDQERDASDALAELRNQGVHLTVDSFGTGFASITYLRRHLADTLKFDCSMVAKLNMDAKLRCVVEGMFSIGKGLGYRVQAKGVETRAQLAFLREAGCEVAQGYLYSPALVATDMSALLARAGADNDPGPTGLPCLRPQGEPELVAKMHSPPAKDNGGGTTPAH